MDRSSRDGRRRVRAPWLTALGPVTVPDGSVFLLGDEREGSIDSRVFGPVDESRLRGVVLATTWPRPRTLPTTPS
ncbi:S26 family signal peptidase [Blastococcus sp. BMG 814]|uniref:S26 family signal peptidase n=1 Tax=Blastococcus carthaginiensis TaxID=3050034 RepID=A0ABT9IEC3_9ACTN|nr:S26 family signal peptidase [Blastococcus carthaginiensis]MDP5183938.1 S26 family signal peptidase [Blastococcus carthaginiensis]